MKEQMKAMARPYATLFLIALAVALAGRVGLAVMDVTGTLSYDYISAADVPILDVVCSILTGSALVAFMYAASLAMAVSTAGVALYGFLVWRGEGALARPATAFLWGWATALVALVCLMIVVLGSLSAVQVGSMSSKLPGPPRSLHSRAGHTRWQTFCPRHRLLKRTLCRKSALHGTAWCAQSRCSRCCSRTVFRLLQSTPTSPHRGFAHWCPAGPVAPSGAPWREGR